jgi:hypothetical protein
VSLSGLTCLCTCWSTVCGLQHPFLPSTLPQMPSAAPAAAAPRLHTHPVLSVLWRVPLLLLRHVWVHSPHPSYLPGAPALPPPPAVTLTP